MKGFLCEEIKVMYEHLKGVLSILLVMCVLNYGVAMICFSFSHPQESQINKVLQSHKIFFWDFEGYRTTIRGEE